jgi:hypothetical protein
MLYAHRHNCAWRVLPAVQAQAAAARDKAAVQKALSQQQRKDAKAQLKEV